MKNNFYVSILNSLIDTISNIDTIPITKESIKDFIVAVELETFVKVSTKVVEKYLQEVKYLEKLGNVGGFSTHKLITGYSNIIDIENNAVVGHINYGGNVAFRESRIFHAICSIAEELTTLYNSSIITNIEVVRTNEYFGTIEITFKHFFYK